MESANLCVIDYPGWRRYIEPGCSMQSIVEYLVCQIETRIPKGPIRIIGISIGGHFGYAAAVQLQAAGREIYGFCALDSFMVVSAAPSSGWPRRAIQLAWRLLGEVRLMDFGRFIRSRLWRAMLRFSQDSLIGLLRRTDRYGRFCNISAVDPILEHELNIRLLIRTAAPGLAALDRDPVALKAPAILLRTALTADSDAGWRRRCPEIKIVQLPGNHETMFEPRNASALSDAFMEATRDWG
jgi:thioesterase domain-containing protein